MDKLNPKKLTTKFKYVTPINPIIPRRYTLTHSDLTAQLFLTIGRQFAFNEISNMRDEVLALWRQTDNGYYLYGRVQVDVSPISKATSAVRYRIFKQELPLALEAIRFGDRAFFNYHPALDSAPIWIYFNSVYPEFAGMEYWGTPHKYI